MRAKGGGGFKSYAERNDFFCSLCNAISLCDTMPDLILTWNEFREDVNKAKNEEDLSLMTYILQEFEQRKMIILQKEKERKL